jgi:hypothetical protein
MNMFTDDGDLPQFDSLRVILIDVTDLPQQRL